MSKPEVPQTETDVIEDYLEEDKPIPGQKYVCLSFISPDKVLEDKKSFMFYNYMKKQNPDLKESYSEFKESFRYYQEDNEESLQEEYDKIVNYQTNVRGIKVRGVYDNLRAANVRAKVLQKLDKSFHVFVGQVGFWLPWDPTANNMADQEYAEPELNRLVKEYKENETKKDMFYEEQKREKQQAAIAENLRLKEQQKAEQEKLEERKKQEEEVNQVSIETPEAENAGVSSENNVDEELKESLDSVDPWMARKMEGEN